MAIQTYYLVRHGQTEQNAKRLLQGRTDSPLTKKGQQQAKALGEQLKKVQFTKVFSSDTKRAMETARLIQQESQQRQTIEPLAGLREYYFGGLEEVNVSHVFFRVINRLGVRKAKKMVQTPDALIGLVNTLRLMDDTGQAESFVDLEKRTNQQFQKLFLVHSQIDHGQFLVVSHGLVLSTLIHTYAPTSVPGKLLKNGSISFLQVNNGRVTVKGVNLKTIPFAFLT